MLNQRNQKYPQNQKNLMNQNYLQNLLNQNYLMFRYCLMIQNSHKLNQKIQINQKILNLRKIDLMNQILQMIQNLHKLNQKIQKFL